MQTTFFKKALKVVAVAALLTGSSLLALEEGKEFKTLEAPIPNVDKSLVKVFSYDCPFCYKYDKSVTPKVMAKLPDMKFVPFHLSTKGTYGKQASQLFAVLIAKDEAAGTPLLDEKSLFKKAKFAYYKAYHDKKERWGDGKDPDAFFKTGFDAAGISKADFEAGLKEPRAQELLKAWGDKDGAAYGVAKIQGVPAFVVNGKYLLYTKAIRGIDQMADMIKELAKK